MKTNGNTILITGGGSGIGRAFAEAFHKLGNEVIIAGRRKQALDEAATANPGLETAVLDIANPAAIKSFAADIAKRFPKLNVVLHSAGIMRAENLLGEEADLITVESTIATNLLGPMRLNAALLQHLLKQRDGAVLTITSGLAFPADGHHANLLRHKGSHPFLQPVFALPTQIHQTAGGRNHPTLCAHWTDGSWPGGRRARHAAR